MSRKMNVTAATAMMMPPRSLHLKRPRSSATRRRMRRAGPCDSDAHPGGHAGAAFASSESPKAPDSDASAQWPTVGCRCRAARPQREEQGDLFFFYFFLYIEGIAVYSSAARDYILAAVPSGAAQEARYPAARSEVFKLSLVEPVRL